MKTITYDETKYKLMPIEPTSEMLVRGGEEFFDSARNWKIGSTLRDQDHAGMIYEGMLAVAPTPPAVEQPNEIPAFMELIGWQVIQKNGLSVGGIARSDEERESMMRSKHLFNPEIDTFRPVYAFRATPPAVEQPGTQDLEDASYRALRELMRLKDTQARIHRSMTVTSFEVDDYQRNKPKAWESARRAVAQQQDSVGSVVASAYRLVEDAKAAGMVVRIDLVPRQPLAMGNVEMIVDVRPARAKETT